MFKAAGFVLIGFAAMALGIPEVRPFMDAVSTAAFGAFLLVWRPA